MPMGKPMQKVYDWAMEFEKSDLMLKYKHRFQHCVYALHDEGTTFFFRGAFYTQVVTEDDIWIVIFPEHHNPVVLNRDDLVGWFELEEFHGIIGEVRLDEVPIS